MDYRHRSYQQSTLPASQSSERLHDHSATNSWHTVSDRGTPPRTKPKQTLWSKIKRRGSLPRMNSDDSQSRWKRPWFIMLVTTAQIVLFAISLIINNNVTGSAIASTSVNPMIGPVSGVLIELGARFDPCMRPGSSPFGPGVTVSPAELCTAFGLNNTITPEQPCTMESICAEGGFRSGKPDQWWRFITPIFVHAGVVHILFNMFFQIFSCRQIEKEIGTWRMALLYLVSGVGGNIFGANFASVYLPSVGASGSEFGIIGVMFVDILLTWRSRNSPGCDMFSIVISLVISLVLGLLGYIDNWAHLGGFITGLLGAIVVLPTAERWGITRKICAFLAFAVIVGVLFGGGLEGYYSGRLGSTCSWCKYVNCVPFREGYCDAVWNGYT